jgi:ADP-ribose pyrophosphatase YjhB (NUDIX family)
MTIDNLLPETRNAVRALIVKNDRVLMLRKDGGERGEGFALPGGSQDVGETLHEALERECFEELGVRVEIGDLLHVADFFKEKRTEPPATRHQVEFLFDCSLPADYRPGNGPKPDRTQIEVVWVPLGELPGLNFHTTSMAPLLGCLSNRHRGVYLGLIG